MKKLFLLIITTCIAFSGAWGQNSFFSDRAVALNPMTNGLVPIPYGQVRVCTSLTQTTPCPNLATVFNAVTGAQLTIGPSDFGQVTTDFLGRFSFQAPPGSYFLQVAGAASNTPQISYNITIGVTGINSLNFPTAAITAASLTLGTAAVYQQAGFPVLTSKLAQLTDTGSSNFFSSPMVFLSRLDHTQFNAGSCFNGPLAACEAPLMRISMSNDQTTNIPGQVGILVDGASYKANGASPPFNANYEVGFGAEMSDSAVDNVTLLRGGNFIVNVFGLPTHAGSGGFTRTAVTLEGDTNNSSGVDANETIGIGSGNFIGGFSASANGTNSSSVAYTAASSAATGKGWAAGFVASGITDVAYGEYVGGAGAFSPLYGFAAQANNSVGFLCGSGTAGSSGGTLGNPNTCMLLDAIGTQGVSETKNSGILSFRAKNASTSGTDWQVQHQAGDSLKFTLVNTATYFKFGNTGNFILNGSAGQHINTFSANNDTDGVLSVTASTSGSKTFSVAYTSAPSCTIIPASDPTAVGVFWVTTTTTTVTANVKTSGTINFMYHCVGNPN